MKNIYPGTAEFIDVKLDNQSWWVKYSGGSVWPGYSNYSPDCEEINPDNTIYMRCEYCRHIVPSNLYKCPECGAPK